MRDSMGSSLWGLIIQSDGMSKGILLILLVSSVICWTIVFYKLLLLSTKRKQLHAVVNAMKTITSFEQLVALAHTYEKSYPGHIITQQLHEAKHILKKNNKRTLSLVDAALLDDKRAAVVEDLMFHEYRYMSFLSISAAVAPLCGLLGTVWGLMHSFISISYKQSADIITVAPGIAEALLTTIAGLLVAIPALVMYGYIKTHIAAVEHQIIMLSDAVHAVIFSSLSESKDSNETSMVPEKAQQQGTLAS